MDGTESPYSHIFLNDMGALRCDLCEGEQGLVADLVLKFQGPFGPDLNLMLRHSDVHLSEHHA